MVLISRGLIVLSSGRWLEVDMKDPKKKFGARVKNLRKRRDLSQEKLALRADLDRAYVGGVERGERNIGLINIFKLATALGVSLQTLFDFEDSEKKDI